MSKFNFIKTDIPDVQIIEPTVFGDDRGYFMEPTRSTSSPQRASTNPSCRITRAAPPKGVLRGLHFQTKHTQGKLVRVTMGEGVRCRRGLPPQQQDLRQVGRRDPLGREQEDALDPEGFRPRLCRAV